MKDIFFKGKAISEETLRVCAVYDAKTGRVVHFHGAVGLEKTASASDEIAGRALAHAKRLGHKTDGLKTLHAPLSAARKPGTYRVDGSRLVLDRPAPERAALLASEGSRRR